ncbi:MAG: hypothetical protein KY395_04435 [Actinobacteria bacterium]|nr:hypothetical protein [Actinomycetota bacterium]
MAVKGSRRDAVAAVAGPPVAWIAHLLVSYAWVPAACQGSAFVLHLATGVFAVMASLSVALGVRKVEGPESSAVMVLGAIFVLAIVLQGVANVVVDACA